MNTTKPVRQDAVGNQSARFRHDGREPGRVIPGTFEQDALVPASPHEMADALAQIAVCGLIALAARSAA